MFPWFTYYMVYLFVYSEPISRGSRSRRSSQRLHSPPVSSPKLPRLIPSKESDDYMGSGEEDGQGRSGRRVTRHQHHEDVKKSKPPPASDSATTSSRHNTRQTLNNNNPKLVLSDRVSPPPPLLIPSHISSGQASSGHGSQPHTPTMQQPSHDFARSREAAVNNIFSWKLFREDYSREEAGSTPCMIYGPHHLLRLFGKY